jgi:hypothetical protein
MFNSATFVGEAQGERQTYYVFSTETGYMVVARRSEQNNYSLTLVKNDAPRLVGRRFKGKRVRVNDLKPLFAKYFDRLNTLYVMVALGLAKKLKERDGRAMLFRVK